jgi:autotransporter-associated beta strand protein
MNHIRHHRRTIGTFLCALLLAWQTGQPLLATTYYWDTDGSTTGNDAVTGVGLGGTGTWDTATSNWWDTATLGTWVNGGGDTAVFTGPAVGIPTLNTVTLSGTLNAAQVRFNRSGYTLTGGTLNLSGAGAGLSATLGDSATISSVISGTDGLTVTGGGSVRLTNNSNSYTGVTTIANGSLIISNPAQLGASSSAISILTTNQTPQNNTLFGFGGGSLVLDGTSGGFTLSRDINFEGRGPIGERGSAILSLGNNTLSGVLTAAVSPLTPVSVRNGRINSVNGVLTIAGTLNVAGTALAAAGNAGTAGTVTNIGGFNAAGVGGVNLTGVLSGVAVLEKNGAGTLFLNPSSTSGFSGQIRIGASAVGQQSTVRVTQLTVGGTSIFGTNTIASEDAASIDLNGGVLEFRNNGNLDFGSLSSGKNVHLRGNSTIFTGPGLGGSAINGLTTLGTFRVLANTTGTFNSRNGYGITLGAWTAESSGNPNTITNNMGGTLTFSGNAWGNSDTTARELTIGGGGNTVITGNLLASGALHTLTKSGAGVLTIRGTGSTITGAVSVTAGAVQITDFRSLNSAATSAISLGNAGTTAGNLIVGITGTTPTDTGLTTSRPIVLSTTTASPSIYANQTGANPVIINGTITRTGQTTGGLILGGSSTVDNVVNSAIPDVGTGGVTKVGAGTWVLAGVNAYTGTTSVLEGVLKVKANLAASTVIADSSALSLGAVNNVQQSGGVFQFSGVSGSATTETMGPFAVLSGSSDVRLVSGGAGAAASLQFSSLGILLGGSSANIDVTGAAGGTLTITGSANTNGIVNARLFYNGADFAASTAGVLGAATYTTAVASMTAANTLPYLIGGSFTQNTATINSGIKFNSNQTLTLGASQTLTVGSGGLGGGILVSGANNAVITGGTGLRASSITSGGGSTTNASTTLTMTSTTGIAPGMAITGTNVPANSYVVAVLSATQVQISNAASATGAGPITFTLGGDLLFRVDGSSDQLTVASILTSGTMGGLTKAGNGVLVLSGVNAQTGTTNINDGTVRLSGSGRLSAANVITNIRAGATLDLNGVGTGTAIGQFNNSGTITNTSATPATLQVGNNNGTGTSRGVIDETSGVISVTKVGTGAQTWQGISNYTGVTTIGSSGLVSVDFLTDIGQPSGIGRGIATSDATNAASLVFNGSTGGLNYRGDRFDGLLTVADVSASTNRLFTLAAAATGARLSSTVGLNNAIIWSNTAAIVNNTTANAIMTFDGDSAGDNTFNPQLVNSTVGGIVLGVTKTGTGQWNLGNSSNSYTGITTVSNGILALNHNDALPANSPLVLGTAGTSGVLQMSGTFARNLAVSATAGTGTITWGGVAGGGGFAAHTTPLTVTLNGGAGLTWGSGGFVGTGGAQPLVFGSASALADVTFTNAIDLGASARTVTVTDNGNTGAEYATLSGVLSGTGGGLTKNGAGILRLTGDNTYTGATTITEGTLVVRSLGNSSNPGQATSVGLSTGANLAAAGITLGRNGNNAGLLQYVGAGETSDRFIQLGVDAGTGSSQIHADGSGPLILTNVNNTATTLAKTLFLRGSNTAGNMVTSQLSDNTGALSVQVDGGATWILTNPANNYTGNTTAAGGMLGIGADTALGSGTLVFSNSVVFAYGGDRVISNAITHNNNVAAGFIGDYSLMFNSVLTLAAGNNNVNTTSNSIVTGKTLTFNGGVTANSITATRAWAFDGSGETIINGDFTTSTAFGININKNGNGTLTLGTNGATSNWNQAGNAVDVDRGTLKFSANEAIPSATAANGGLTVSPELFTNDTATVDLNGTTQTVNALTAITDGVTIIDNKSATPATFRFGANNSTVDFGSGTGSYTITDTGAGALSIVKLGNTSTTFSAGLNLTYQGATRVEGGGLTIASALNGTNALQVVNSGSTLALTGGITTPSTITGVVVENGATLSLLDGVGTKLTSLASLQLGSSGGANSTLNFNVGDGVTAGDNLNTDLLSLITGGTLNLFAGNTITFNLTDAGLNPNQQYVLLDATAIGGGFFGGPLNLADYLLGGTPGGFTSIDLTTNSTTNQIILTTGNLITGDLFWRGLAGGGTDATWNGNANNWSLDKANTTPATSIPGQGTDVIFAIDSASGAVATTLEQNFKINSLTFEAGTSTPTSVTIAPGTLSTNRLEVAPQVATDGVAITAGGPASVTISAPFRLGANQTWTVADAASVLTFSGALQGERNVTKEGDGRVVLSAAADPTFNAGQTANFTVNDGTLEMTNLTALGSLANSNIASVSVNAGGAFYYNNATATTAAVPIRNAITLNGGALSLGGANHFIGPVVTVSGNSIINLRDSNSATLTATARNLTLNNGLTGAGDLTLDSTDDGMAANQLAGTLTLNQDNSAWSGDLTLLRGSITTNNANGLGSGSTITFDNGRISFTAGAGTPTIAQDIVIASAGGAAIGELSMANGIATTYSGDLTLGGAGGTGELRVFMSNDAATATFTGDVVLANNGLIGTQSAATRVAEFSGVISESGGARTLTINDATWGGTAGTVRLSGANTYTGGTNLARGILSLGDKDALGTGTLTLTGGSTLQAAVDLSAGGSGPVANAVTLNANLTVSGSNNLTLSGTFTGTGGDANRSVSNSLTSGNLVLSGTVNIGAAANTAARSLIFTGASNTEVTGVIADGNGFANVLNKIGTGTLTISGTSNTYTGATQVDNGTMRNGATNALPITTAMRIGTTTTAGTYDLNGFDQTIGSLVVQTTSNSVTNQIIVDTGNTLTINGAVTIGIDADNSNTNLNALGGGSIVVNSGGANFSIGAATGATNDSRVDVDFSGLNSFTANLGAGVFRLGDPNTGTDSNPSTFILAENNSITASLIRVGDGSGGTALHTLTLGSGTNALNADTINVGSAGATIRSSGLITFDSGDTTGEVTIRGSMGGSTRANINLVNTTGNTGGDITGTLDFDDHDADIMADVVTMASRTQNSGDATATLNFNQGLLDITTLNMASRTGTGAGEAFATTNIGGGNATIGTLNMAVNTSSGAGSASTATLNISAGTVNIGTGSGTAINMANAGTGRTVTSNINLTGGVVDITGDVIRTGGLGTENATVTLNGSTLDMNGFTIGTSAAAISFAAQMGTLENLAELNGGSTPLTKTTSGTLIMQGSNTYTGGTAINGGVLQVNSSGAIGSTGTVSFGGGTLQYTANNTTDYSNRFSTAASQAYSIHTNGQNVTYATDLSSSGGTLTKLGTGTLVLTADNTFTGTTTVSGGTLQVGNGTTGSLAGTGAVIVSSGAMLSGSGGIGGSVTVSAGGVLAPGVGTVGTSNQTLTLSSVGGLAVADGGQISISITDPTNTSLLTFNGGSYTFNSNNYANAGLLFASEPTALATWNVAPSAVLNHDFVNITAGGLALGDRSAAGYGNGSFLVTDNGFIGGSPTVGQVFNLIDWLGVMTGNFDVGGNTFGNSGTFGDLDLPTLTGGLAWDVTAFTSYGIVVVVPEPSRVMLLFFGLLGFLLRRRRK